MTNKELHTFVGKEVEVFFKHGEPRRGILGL